MCLHRRHYPLSYKLYASERSYFRGTMSAPFPPLPLPNHHHHHHTSGFSGTAFVDTYPATDTDDHFNPVFDHAHNHQHQHQHFYATQYSSSDGVDSPAWGGSSNNLQHVHLATNAVNAPFDQASNSHLET